MATNTPTPVGARESVQQVQGAVHEAANYAVYFWHLLKDKPVLVAMGTILSTVMAKFTAVLPDHIASLGALFALLTIDLITKYNACRKQGLPFTSRIMRDKGLPKFRDYLLLYIAGALTIPLLGDVWGHKSVMYFLAMVELWSIAENLYDSGNLPFDIRQMAMFNGIRDLIAGRVMTPPESAPATETPAIPEPAAEAPTTPSPAPAPGQTDGRSGGGQGD
jgi:hypothetical protein